MNVFLCDFSSYIMKEIASTLREKGVNILYWTGCKQVFEEASRDRNRFPDTIFHSQFDAVQAKPAPGINDASFDPPSHDLLSRLLECESIVLTMMNRADFKNMTVSKKKHLYYRFVQYWDGVLQAKRPDLIIFSDIPHAIYNFVLYSVAKARGIPTVMFEVTNLYDRLILVRDYQSASPETGEAYRQLGAEDLTTKELEPNIKTYYEQLTDPNTEPTPRYKLQRDQKMKEWLTWLPRPQAVFSNLVNGRIVQTTYYHLRAQFRREARLINIDANDRTNYKNFLQLKKAQQIKRALREEYASLQTMPQEDEKFIYFPLQFQPENTTSPLAGFFVDQILTVKTLAAALPPDWKLYVKEYSVQLDDHDPRAHLYRYPGYYREMAKHPSVRLIPPSVSSFDLIKHSQAVATASGSPGWEGLARGKSVLLFGYPWYMYCDGVYRVRDTQGCRDAIVQIQKNPPLDPRHAIRYLLALQRTSIRGTQTAFSQRYANLPPETSIRNMVEALYQEILRCKQSSP